MGDEKKTYAVWVGSLTEGISENDLFLAFKDYGVICSVRTSTSRDGRKIGFVNFYDKEVAEVAANDMDGAVIKGAKIESSFKNEEHKVKDRKTLTDCQYFIQGEPCSKGDECIFRHNKAARASITECDKWQEKKCKDLNCEKRHTGPKAKEIKAENSSIKAGQPVGIYWDIENCRLPLHIEPRLFVEKIWNAFLQSKKLVEFLCCCDTKRMSQSVVDGLSKAGVDVLHVSAGAKNPAYEKLKLQMDKFGSKYNENASIILISGDVNFAEVLQKLRYSHGVYVTILHNSQASDYLKSQANETCEFQSFIDGSSFQTSPRDKNAIKRTKDLFVKHLPFDEEMEEKVKERLSILFSNFGGQVGIIFRHSAIGMAWCTISFASPDDADWALQRLQGSDVFGREILIERHFSVDQKYSQFDAHILYGDAKQEFQYSRAKQESPFQKPSEHSGGKKTTSILTKDWNRNPALPSYAGAYQQTGDGRILPHTSFNSPSQPIARVPPPRTHFGNPAQPRNICFPRQQIPFGNPGPPRFGAFGTPQPHRDAGNFPAPRDDESKSYSVWVGYLTDDTTEQDLINRFNGYNYMPRVHLNRNKSGQKYAFFNFYNKGDAERAVNEMNGSLINGWSIRAQIKTSTKEDPKERDLRAFSDCYHFMEERPCPKDCRFRHCETAKLSIAVCKQWLNHKCEDLSCAKRHPGKGKWKGQLAEEGEVQLHSNLRDLLI